MQWALQLSDHLIALNFSNKKVNKLRKEALLYIGERSSNPNKRNYFLTSAIELDDSFEGFPRSEITQEVVDEISIDTLFNLLSVSLNPENIFKDNYTACFKFSSGLNKSITIRNDVAAVSNEVNLICDILIKSDELTLKMALSGLTSPVMALAKGDIEVEGGKTDFLQFLASFRQ